MGSLILSAVVLYVAVCFGPSRCQGNHVFQPKIRNVSMTKYFHHLQLEWEIHGDSKAYSPETEIVFNIQVNQTEENHIVLNTNHSVPLSQLEPPLEWSWDPLVPLQCVRHVIRIRSLVMNPSFPRSETWSNWSPWEAVTGLDTVDDNDNYALPNGQAVKAGSNVTFCCIAKKNETVFGFQHDGTWYYADRKQRKMLFHLTDVRKEDVLCQFSDNDVCPMEIYVIELPSKPKMFSCETKNNKTFRCSWKAEMEDRYHYPNDLRKTEFILSDVSYTKTYCKEELLKKVEEQSCSFKIGEEPIPNFRLTAKNCFGENYTDYGSDVTENGYGSDVTQSGDLSFVIVLFLVIISLMLICVCFWKSSCIRNHCFPDIPHPVISPFLKLDSGTMGICDVAPDKLEVMEKHQTSVGQQSDLGMLIIENTTYFDPTHQDLNLYLNRQEREAKSKEFNPPMTSYRPLQDFFADKPSSQPPPCDQGNFSYTSQTKVPDSVAQLGDLPCLAEAKQHANYKPQQATGLETNPTDSDEYVHFK